MLVALMLVLIATTSAIGQVVEITAGPYVDVTITQLEDGTYKLTVDGHRVLIERTDEPVPPNPTDLTANAKAIRDSAAKVEDTDDYCVKLSVAFDQLQKLADDGQFDDPVVAQRAVDLVFRQVVSIRDRGK